MTEEMNYKESMKSALTQIDTFLSQIEVKGASVEFLFKSRAILAEIYRMTDEKKDWS